MKYGVRKPSINKRIAARTSVRRYVRHSLGFKAPRGWGWLTNPRKAAYNRVYNRTSFSLGTRKGGPDALIILATVGVVILVFKLLAAIVAGVFRWLGSATGKKSTVSSNEDRHRLPEYPCCPRCSSGMVERKARRGKNSGKNFLGCSNFPRCRGTRDLPEQIMITDIRMESE